MANACSPTQDLQILVEPPYADPCSVAGFAAGSIFHRTTKMIVEATTGC